MNKTLSLIALLVALAAIYFWMFNGHDRPSNLETTAETTATPSAVANVEGFHDWNEYTSPNQQFKVLMPHPPHNAIEDIQDPKTKEMRNYQIFVSAKEDGTLFSIYAISFPENAGKNYDEAFLQNFMNEMLKSNPTTKVKDIKIVAFRDRKAVDFDLETQDAAILGKAFFKGKTLYVLSQTTKHDKKNPKEFEFFVNSFQLMQKTPPSDKIKAK